MEKGESPKEVAERELYEETGMKVIRYLPEPYLTETYQIIRAPHLVEKTVRFYFAEVTTLYTLQKEELLEGKWLPLKELLSYAAFPEEKDIYRSVIKRLS